MVPSLRGKRLRKKDLPEEIGVVAKENVSLNISSSRERSSGGGEEGVGRKKGARGKESSEGEG